MLSRTSALVDQLILKYENRLGVHLSEVPATKVEPVPIQVSAPPAVEQKPVEEVKTQPEAPKSHHEESKEQVDLSQAPYDLFPQIDIRVGNIVDCWKHPSSDALYCEKIDLGEPAVREIGSGLQKHIPITDMSGLVLVMANLKPRKLGGFNSNGMVMALHAGDVLELVRPNGALMGERVGLEGVLDPPGKTPILPALNPKKKILEKAIGFFATDAEGFACFGLKRMVTSAGFIKTPHAHGKIS
jgi:aminoacyl tRNA synthase complex-interacting multifunctional protein 1